MKVSKQEAYLAAVRSDLKVFLMHSFKSINSTSQYIDNWHIDAIIHCLELSITGEMPRLIINLPPRQLKSFIVSVVLPAFILGRDPTAKIICISYSDELAKSLALEFRRIVESSWYQQLFPHVRPIKMTANEFVTEDGGFRYATSVGGSLTGRGGDFIIIDDPIKPDDTHSDKVRQTVNEWYQTTLLSRLDDKKRSVLILVMQRLHVNDLTGFVEAKGGFFKLSLPAIAIRDDYIDVSDTEQYFRKEGEPLHEEREDIDTLEMMKNELGSFYFDAQYQQTPQSPEGALFKRKWINFISEPPNLMSGGQLIVSIDTALSTSETADYTAISLIYSSEEGHYLLYAERGHWEYETIKAKALSYYRRYGRELIFVVEAAVSGHALIQFLNQHGISCFSSHPKQDKMTRACKALPVIEAGRFYIVDPEGDSIWARTFVDELLCFPHGRFDDLVDSLIQVLPWAERRVNPIGKIYFFG